jgi:hypothetical protein
VHAVSRPASSNTPSVSDGDLWPRVLQIASENVGDRQRVEHLVLQSFDGVTLRLSMDDAGADIARFVMGQVERINDLVKRAAGRSVRVEIDSSRIAPRPTAESTSAGPLPEMVQMAVDLFGATVIAVE